MMLAFDPGVFLVGLAFVLFFLGLTQCLTSKNFLGFLFGIEIIINAANVNLLGFLQIQPNRSDIQPIMVMFIGFAVIEMVVGLAIFTWAKKSSGTEPSISMFW